MFSRTPGLLGEPVVVRGPTPEVLERRKKAREASELAQLEGMGAGG